jgi:protein involved in polysaccharide export with SLBB domain
MIERLRTTQAAGRIALGFSEQETTLEMLMNIALEDGDRLFVPVRPATVNVLGAVYGTGSLLHKEQWRVKDYLKRSGGCTRAADRSRVFLVRADGTVLSRHGFGRFGPSFEMARVHPGDSIVVPETLPKWSPLRGIGDWTQIFSQLALGTAMINVLK